jgi:hypothetical protein
MARILHHDPILVTRLRSHTDGSDDGAEVTVKMHRNRFMRKLCAKSVAMLARMVEALGIAR